MRLALSSDPCNEEGCTAMIIHNSNASYLAFCRIGDKAWTPLKNQFINRKQIYEDVTYSSNDPLFYALTFEGQIEGWDLKDPSSPTRAHTWCLSAFSFDTPDPPTAKDQEIIDSHIQLAEYLVESPQGDIPLVQRSIVYVGFDGSTILKPMMGKISSNLTDLCCFVRQKLNFQDQKAEFVEGLNDAALFIGRSGSACLSATDHPGLKPNSIH